MAEEAEAGSAPAFIAGIQPSTFAFFAAAYFLLAQRDFAVAALVAALGLLVYGRTLEGKPVSQQSSGNYAHTSL